MKRLLHYHNEQLHCEALPLATLAQAAGTPLYVYSQAELLRRVGAFAALPERSLVCYSVKANGNPAILRLLGAAGLGADVTSGGELFLARQAGIPAQKIIFSGVGKQRHEIEAALRAGIRALHVESEMEMEVVAAVAAEMGRVAAVGVRVNPDIHVRTHAYISTGEQGHKFGVPPETAVSLLHFAQKHPWLEPVSLAAHIGSQITDLEPFVQTAEFLVALAGKLRRKGIRLAYLDTGGGFGIDYTQSGVPDVREWITAVAQPILRAGYEIVMEPGRSIVGPAGALLTQVVYTKQQGEKHFTIVDAGMNDLLRPTLYGAFHPLLPVRQASASAKTVVTEVVGPVCETGDFLAKERPLPLPQPGDLLAILHTGAYGFGMSSNYNGRLRPAELLVNGDQWHTIRQRQTFQHLLDGC